MSGDRSDRLAREADGLRWVRAAAAAAVGGVIGALVFGGAVGSGVAAATDRPEEGLAALGAAIAAAAVGALIGASIALAVAFRRSSARFRRVVIVTVLLAGPPLCALVALVLSRTAWFPGLDTRHLFIVWLVVVLPATAVVGNWVATRHTGDAGQGSGG